MGRLIELGSLLFFVLSICVLSAPNIEAATDTILPSASELIDGVVARAAARHLEKPQYSFERIAEVEKLDGDGLVKRKERRVFHSVEIDGETYDRLITVDGHGLNDEERSEEAERLEKWKQSRSDRKKENEPFFNKKLLERYVFSVSGEEILRGRKAYVVHFRPDEAKSLPEEDDNDRFLNAFAGSVWVDAKEYAIARIDAHLIGTVRYGLGLLAYFKKVTLRFEQRRSTKGDWLPHGGRTYIWGRSLLFKPIRTRETNRFVRVKRIR